jgi:hypothetical protein
MKDDEHLMDREQLPTRRGTKIGDVPLIHQRLPPGKRGGIFDSSGKKLKHLGSKN